MNIPTKEEIEVKLTKRLKEEGLYSRYTPLVEIMSTEIHNLWIEFKGISDKVANSE